MSFKNKLQASYAISLTHKILMESKINLVKQNVSNKMFLPAVSQCFIVNACKGVVEQKDKYVQRGERV